MKTVQELRAGNVVMIGNDPMVILKPNTTNPVDGSNGIDRSSGRNGLTDRTNPEAISLNCRPPSCVKLKYTEPVVRGDTSGKVMNRPGKAPLNPPVAAFC